MVEIERLGVRLDLVVFLPSIASSVLFRRLRTVRLYFARLPNFGMADSLLKPRWRKVTLSIH